VRHAGKVDVNHAAIRDGLRAIYGPDSVQDASRWSGAGFDLIACIHGRITLLEVKQPRKVTRLTESELAARARYGDCWRVVCTLDEALAAVGA
jgi:hypothetical protein